MRMNIKSISKTISILCFLLFFNCGKEEKAPEVVLRPVKYIEVSYLGGNIVREFSGTAKTETVINLSFRNTGIITVLNMKLGQKVKKGDLLSKLDNVESRLNYESSIESQNSAESQMNTAKLNLSRIRTLYEKGSSSLSDYEDAKNSYRTAVSSFESSKRSVAIQQEQIKFGFLYAAEDGVIAAVNSEVDENVSPGEVVGVLNAGSAIEISLGLPESVINAVKKDIQAQISFTAIPGETFRAKVTEVAPALDPNTSTYPVTVMVIDADPRIKSGMAANILFEFPVDHSLDKTMVVPSSAVGEDGTSRFVFLISGDENKATVKKHPITVGKLRPEGFEIKSGLSIGQKVATAGLQTLLDGQEVKLN